jgi:Na+:H+ antiporter, NhaA family
MQQPPDNGHPEIFYAPLERSFSRVITPFEEFINRQTTSGLLLMGMAVLALVLANSGLAEMYDHLLHIPVSVAAGAWSVEMSLHHWVNDGLMAFFFFIVGLELKREFLVGELAEPRKALLPILAAIGGMAVPALFYYLLNPEGASARGWGIPMATDIAFAIGALVLLGRRVPKALITFLVALAIVDDLGAVMVIAIFYTDHLVIEALGAAAGIVAVLFLLNMGGVRVIPPYFLLAVCLWYALLLSGIHPTLAGVLGAFTVPARPKYDPGYFNMRAKELLAGFEDSYRKDRKISTNIELRSIVEKMEKTVLRVMTPLQRLEHIWHLPVAYLVMPVFALFNAGIALGEATRPDVLLSPIALGIGLGLIGGKFIGIAGASWLALRFGVAALPEQTRFSQIIGVSLLAGIGFTMSMFIAQLAFEGHASLLLAAKTGILLASFTAGIGGFIWLWLIGGTQDVKQAG